MKAQIPAQWNPSGFVIQSPIRILKQIFCRMIEELPLWVKKYMRRQDDRQDIWHCLSQQNGTTLRCHENPIARSFVLNIFIYNWEYSYCHALFYFRNRKGCCHLSNNSTQPDRHRTEGTNYSANKNYKLTKQRNHLRMIRELIITNKNKIFIQISSPT